MLSLAFSFAFLFVCYENVVTSIPLMSTLIHPMNIVIILSTSSISPPKACTEHTINCPTIWIILTSRYTCDTIKISSIVVSPIYIFDVCRIPRASLCRTFPIVNKVSNNSLFYLLLYIFFWDKKDPNWTLKSKTHYNLFKFSGTSHKKLLYKLILICGLGMKFC